MTNDVQLLPEATPRPRTDGFASILRQRHVMMLGLGSAIGAGLFVGSGAAIAAAGPGVILSYLLVGLTTLVVMKMLGEMAARFPSSGSFSLHAERALGGWAGFCVGWLYWSQLVVLLAVEAAGAAIIMHGWIPTVDTWVWVLVFMATFTAMNLVTVGLFGELEFWLAGMKVFAILAFLALAVLALLGVLPGGGAAANLTEHGGFLPNGWSGILVGILAVFFAFGGAEIVTIAAAESDDPVAGIRRAMRSVVWRLAIFYVGSLAVIVTIIPWNELEVGHSPFVAVLERLEVPAAAQLMNVVVLTALLSALNANIYSSSRMIFSLAARGGAARSLLTLSARGVPYVAVVASVGFGFFSAALNLLWPDTVFLWLLNSVAAVGLVLWFTIGVSHFRLRGQVGRRDTGWRSMAPSVFTLAVTGAVLVALFVQDSTRWQIVATAILTVVIVVAALVHRATPPVVVARANTTADRSKRPNGATDS